MYAKSLPSFLALGGTAVDYSRAALVVPHRYVGAKVINRVDINARKEGSQGTFH